MACPWAIKGMAAKEVFCLLSCHPTWFICSLALGVMLWAKRRHTWNPFSCRVDLSGKTAIVTGANSGIGKYVALDLARRNACTILACRNKERGEAVLEEIRKATGNPNVHLRILDISSMASVRDFAKWFLGEERQLDILINNAGVTGLPHSITAEGLELTFATNFLGAFLLTNLLLEPWQIRSEQIRAVAAEWHWENPSITDAMKAAASARIVNVSSYRHFVGKMNVKFLSGKERVGFDQAYSSTKLMNVVFTLELARRLQGTGVSVTAVNPGTVRTGIMRHFSWWMRLLYYACGLFLKSAEEGAVSTLYCAVSPEVQGITGKYFDSDCSLKLPAALAQDPAMGCQLWDASEQLTSLEYGGKQ